MPRFDWRDRDDMRRGEDPGEGRDLGRRDDFGQADYSNDYAYDPRRRAGYRAEETVRGDDHGQADYSKDYAYDRTEGRAYRRFSEDDRDYGRRGEPADYEQRMNQGDYRSIRAYDEKDMARPDAERDRHEGRSWTERAGAFFGGGRPDEHRDRDVRDVRHEPDLHDRRTRRRGGSDRVLWAVIVERLEDERRLDLRDVDVVVENGEVTLNGTVRHKDDKRRIEDIADIEGVRHVQNNLRVRDRGSHRGPWAFI